MEWFSNGLWDLSALGLVVFTLVVTHITMISVTVYLHRHSAHRAVDLHPVLQHFFRFWLWLTTGMITREWTAIHRKHHAVCETPDDPHSPQIQGLKKILWQGAEAYKIACAQRESIDRYGAGCPDDWVERNVYSRHTSLGITLVALIDIALFGPIGLTIWAVQMAWTPLFAAGVVNGIGHYWGYRNFECPDAATNIVPWGILIAGEELHNNHHTYPNSAKLSQKPWEFDMGWFWIRLFQIFGLAQPRSTGPVAHKVPGRRTLDLDTAWALLNDRFRVMSRYAEDVVKPLVEQELSATKRVVRNAKKALTLESSLVDAAARIRIDELIDSSATIKTIYEFRLRLQEVWAKRGGNAEEMLQLLKQWCIDAEATGIQALRDFVTELQTYTLQKTATA
ncbi:MAG: fatty acid desaturase [Gammaproteobacteria bacterium]|nr:fatty acid desaturase [Gammaproteobacteria bacterium]